jgi:hypothetical protein
MRTFTTYKTLLIFLPIVLVSWAYGAAPTSRERLDSFFKNIQVTTEYSPLLVQKQNADTLLPDLDGDAALAELLRRFPDLWTFKRLENQGELLTALSVELVYIDGNKEDQTCTILEGSEKGVQSWNLRIGVDFVGGGSLVVKDHIGLCLQEVRDSLGYVVQQGEKVIYVPPRDVIKEMDENRVNAQLDFALKKDVLAVQKEVEVSGSCPKDIDAYILLMEIYEQVAQTPMDLLQISNELNVNKNGNKQIHSCAFSRRWNQRYSEVVNMECSVDDGTCRYLQSEDGTTRWVYQQSQNTLEFDPLTILFLRFGGKSVHKGGTMLDLRLIPLSKNLYLEAFLDANQKPVSLGIITIGKENRLEQ